MTPPVKPEEQKAPPRVSVVVVSRNRVESLRKCLQSIENSQGRDTFQVIVVDNGSSDGSAQLDTEFTNVQWIRLPKNFGLTKAWNLGWRAADAEYVLFVHDDTELDPQAVNLLASALDANADAGAVCPLLIDAAGNPAPQLGELPPTGNFRPAKVNGTDPIPVEYPRGAALMMRVFLIKSIRQIDERYGQFGSDADLATQIRRGGKKVLLIPAARARHQGHTGATSLERADATIGRAVFLSKYQGFGPSLKIRIGAALGALAGFRLGELRYVVSDQKIDGTQE